MLNQNHLAQKESSRAKYVPAGTGPAYCGPGDRLTFLMTGAETGGAFFMAGVAVAPGGGAPPHVHSREDESFFVQRGTLTFQVGGKELIASTGDFIHIPRGTAHSFKNAGEEPAALLMVATPAGLENFFAEAFIPAADIADFPQLAEAVIGRARKAAPKYGLELLLPPASHPEYQSANSLLSH
jgi:quercetin dioxygenase-like cupin family protein